MSEACGLRRLEGGSFVYSTGEGMKDGLVARPADTLCSREYPPTCGGSRVGPTCRAAAGHPRMPHHAVEVPDVEQGLG